MDYTLFMPSGDDKLGIVSFLLKYILPGNAYFLPLDLILPTYLRIFLDLDDLGDLGYWAF
jgi:hypothetical protein